MQADDQIQARLRARVGGDGRVRISERLPRRPSRNAARGEVCCTGANQRAPLVSVPETSRTRPHQAEDTLSATGATGPWERPADFPTFFHRTPDTTTRVVVQTSSECAWTGIVVRVMESCHRHLIGRRHTRRL